MMRRLATGLCIVAGCALAGCAGNVALDDIRPDTGSDPCGVRQWTAPDLYGTWSVELPELGQRGELRLRRHPEFSASLRGEFDYGGHRSIASGDVEQGLLNLDESRDGRSFYAFWTGNLVADACGREIRGMWQKVTPEGAPPVQSPFTLRREDGRPAGGW